MVRILNNLHGSVETHDCSRSTLFSSINHRAEGRPQHSYVERYKNVDAGGSLDGRRKTEE